MPQGNRKRISRKAGKGQFIKDWGTPAVPAGHGAVGWPRRAGAQQQGCPLTLGVLVEPPVLCSGRAPNRSRHFPSCSEGTLENPRFILGGAACLPQLPYELPVHHHQRSRLHLWLGLAFLSTEGRGKGGKVTQTLPSLAGAGGGEGEANSIEQLRGGPQIC